MNKEYFESNEKTDFEKLCQFNNEKSFFKELAKTPEKHIYDASGRTNDGRLVCIELKSRNAVLTKENTVSGHNFNGQTVFIEDEKFTALAIQNYVNHAIPLYINFLDDGHVLIWNLSQLKREPEHKVTIIRNKGYNKIQKCYRNGLYLSDAKIYSIQSI